MKKVILIISAMILILSFSRVKADTQQASVWVTYYSDQAKTTQLASSGQFQYFEPTANGNAFTGKNIFITTQTRTNDFDYILIPFQITGREYYNNSDYLDREILCDWTAEQTASSDYEISSYDCRYWGTGTYNSPAPIEVHMNITLASTTSSAQSPCTIDTQGYLKCMLLNNVDYDKMILSYSLANQNSSVPIRFNFGHVVGRYTSAVDRQQQAIEGVQQQQQQTNEIMNQTIEYNNETNTNTIGANETMQAGQMEDQLIQENEFNGSIMDGMTIDSSASGFIWQIMERLRGMNIAIVTLMTMALGLGVIKLVLNR